jgi:hypothetical protein
VGHAQEGLSATWDTRRRDCPLPGTRAGGTVRFLEHAREGLSATWDTTVAVC